MHRTDSSLWQRIHKFDYDLSVGIADSGGSIYGGDHHRPKGFIAPHLAIKVTSDLMVLHFDANVIPLPRLD
jgi:hypothetical protein